MKKYIVIERGCRGEFENVEVLESEKNIESFCIGLYENKVEEMRKNLNEEELDELKEYMEEFSGVSIFEEGSYEVCLNEELNYEVYEVVM